jgi:hypothetical protein
MKKTILFLSLLAACTGAFAQDAPLWLRKNQISPDGKSIAFSYNGNIYEVDS